MRLRASESAAGSKYEFIRVYLMNNMRRNEVHKGILLFESKISFEKGTIIFEISLFKEIGVLADA